MSLHLRPLPPVPDETARIARRAFRRGNPYLQLRDTLGPLFTDADFVPVYGHAGGPAISPAQVALVTVLQYAENLTDEQAADAVRSRLDWKYLLGLPLDDPGFDATVLGDFRRRLIRSEQEQLPFVRVLEALQAHGLVRARGTQRTDSTHVLAAVSRLNRLELVGETLRAALNALALADPAWLRAQGDPAWVDRYGPRLPSRRLPKEGAKREALLRQMGRDGRALLERLDRPETPAALGAHPAVATLRRVWEQHYTGAGEGLRPRPLDDLPPGGALLASPYDCDARASQKRETLWTGYKVHLTETCDEGLPRIITQVATTEATVPDTCQTGDIQLDLAARDLLPAAHLVDMGYASVAIRVASARDHGVEVVAPVQPDSSWQARAGGDYGHDAFTIDWEREVATCPEGKESSTWRPVPGRSGEEAIQIHFRMADCGPCPAKALCTRADRRSLTVPTRPAFEAQRQARAAQAEAAFREAYARRAGIEGTISQGVRRCDLRHARYRGQAKTRLEHLLTATALNVVRALAWLGGSVPATTRTAPFVRVLAPAA